LSTKFGHEEVVPRWLLWLLATAAEYSSFQPKSIQQRKLQACGYRYGISSEQKKKRTTKRWLDRRSSTLLYSPAATSAQCGSLFWSADGMCWYPRRQGVWTVVIRRSFN